MRKDPIIKAWQFTGTNEPLMLTEVPDPKPGPGQVVVEVKAAGLCHTDVGVLTDEGWLSTLVRLPITPGHEVSGEVSRVGAGVTGWSVGDRVGICPTTPVGPRDSPPTAGSASRLSLIRWHSCAFRTVCPSRSARPVRTRG